VEKLVTERPVQRIGVDKLLSAIVALRFKVYASDDEPGLLKSTRCTTGTAKQIQRVVLPVARRGKARPVRSLEESANRKGFITHD
jgi:hypothetical protein